MSNDQIRPEWVPSAYSEAAKTAPADGIRRGDAQLPLYKRQMKRGQVIGVGSISRKLKGLRQAPRARR